MNENKRESLSRQIDAVNQAAKEEILPPESEDILRERAGVYRNILMIKKISGIVPYTQLGSQRKILTGCIKDITQEEYESIDTDPSQKKPERVGIHIVCYPENEGAEIQMSFFDIPGQERPHRQNPWQYSDRFELKPNGVLRVAYPARNTEKILAERQLAAQRFTLVSSAFKARRINSLTLEELILCDPAAAQTRVLWRLRRGNRR